MVDNSVSRAFRNVLRNEPRQGKAAGVNNNATVDKLGDNISKKVDKRTIKSNKGGKAIKPTVQQMQGNKSQDHDGIQVQVNESEDEFGNESDVGGTTTDSSSEGLASDQSDGEHDIFMLVN